MNARIKRFWMPPLASVLPKVLNCGTGLKKKNQCIDEMCSKQRCDASVLPNNIRGDDEEKNCNHLSILGFKSVVFKVKLGALCPARISSHFLLELRCEQ